MKDLLLQNKTLECQSINFLFAFSKFSFQVSLFCIGSRIAINSCSSVPCRHGLLSGLAPKREVSETTDSIVALECLEFRQTERTSRYQYSEFPPTVIALFPSASCCMAVGMGFNLICGIRKHREICVLMVFIEKGKIPHEIILMSVRSCTNIPRIKNLTPQCAAIFAVKGRKRVYAIATLYEQFLSIFFALSKTCTAEKISTQKLCEIKLNIFIDC